MKITVISLLALLAACGPTSSKMDSGSDDVDAGDTDAGLPDAGSPDAGPPCALDRACEVTWTESAEYPKAVDHHTTFVLTGDAGTHLYVAGGFAQPGDDSYATVRRANIGSDGSLGEWEDTTPLGATQAFHGQAQVGNRVYLIGGITTDAMGPLAGAAVNIGELDANGQLSWRAGANLKQAFVHPTASAIGDKLFLVGGGLNGAHDAVVMATIGADGLISAWVKSAKLPAARTHHAAVVWKNHIYVFGGFSKTDIPHPSILRSVHDDSTGAIVAWIEVGTMTDPPWTAAATLIGDTVFLVGGGEGGRGEEKMVARVRRARFLEDGTLSPFEDAVSPLPVARSHVHQAPFFDGRIYSVGGRLQMGNGVSMQRVFIGALQ